MNIDEIIAGPNPVTDGATRGANDADAIYETFMDDHLPPAANNANSPPGSGTQSVPGNGEPLF